MKKKMLYGEVQVKESEADGPLGPVALEVESESAQYADILLTATK